jgi:hypothetical protein
MWPAFAVGVMVIIITRRDISAPGCQDLYCSGVILVIIEEDFCSARCVCMCLLLVICICQQCLSGACQVAVRSWCRRSVNDLVRYDVYWYCCWNHSTLEMSVGLGFDARLPSLLVLIVWERFEGCL